MDLHNRRIIVNNDFDGCLSASVLIKLYGCKVIGFSNSKDKIWLIDNETLCNDTLFVDMFAVNYDSVEQHILPFYYEHNFSPNRERGRFAFNCYWQKYPFSTFIWLLCNAAKEGKNIEGFIPPLSIDGAVFKNKDIILRADDILLNYLKYNKNSVEWRNFLYEYSNKDKNIVSLFSFLEKQKIEEVEKWKENIDLFFSEKYGFSREEIPAIETYTARKFLKRFNIEFKKVTDVINLIHKRCRICTEEEFRRFYEENKEQLFSFAFVFSPSTANKPNFSYSLYNTTDNKKINKRNVHR